MAKEAPRAAHAQNEFGADLWIKDPKPHRAPTQGRGMFAGLQDVKHYNVDHGWAKRDETPQSGLVAFLWNRIFGGSYRPPSN
ncbi:hypothetical protein MPDQ_002760 [Monascus purpureus]|uniref:Uncharacterized protein n=1 Tax=Monascus purpureus TaxID=5098 RepID=A0A507R4C7_MONPU|nr:hypothetical protein MPDQ_002760 [Monascus purpureus]